MSCGVGVFTIGELEIVAGCLLFAWQLYGIFILLYFCIAHGNFGAMCEGKGHAPLTVDLTGSQGHVNCTGKVKNSQGINFFPADLEQTDHLEDLG